MKIRGLLALLLMLSLIVSLSPSMALADNNKAEIKQSQLQVTVNGETVEMETYNINGSNYFKLRDVAEVMNGTASQFGVAFNDASKTVDISLGEAYAAVGGELTLGSDKSETCFESLWSIKVNGTAIDVDAYTIGGNNYFKLRDLGVALGLIVDYDDSTGAVSIDAGGYSLVFDSQAYNKYSVSLDDGSLLEYRAYENIVYESNPALVEYNVMTVYVPEAYFNGEAIGQYNIDNAPIFLKNGIGGYLQATISNLYSETDGSKTANVYGKMLQHGLVIVSAAARGNNSETDENGVSKGIAPAGVVDMKSVIRYLRYNDNTMQGDAERIISDGTSAGGAISALLAVSGNAPVYEDYLAQVGAADESDEVYAAFCYVPILDLENLNEAYEWFYMGTSLDWYQGKSTWSKNSENYVEMTDVEKILSPIFAENYIEYINSKELISPLDGVTQLTLDENGDGTYRDLQKQLLIASAQESLDENGELVGTKYDGTAECFTVENGIVTDVDINAYLCCIQRLTGVGGMDNGFVPKNQYGEDMGLVQTNEAKVFAIDGADSMVHFDAKLYPSMLEAVERGADFSYLENYGLTISDFQVTEGLDPNEPGSIVYMMNPLNFIGDNSSDTAAYFFICAGACDNDVSMITATLLGASLYTAGEVNEDTMVLKYQWDQKHGGDYDIQEMFDWIDSIV